MDNTAEIQNAMLRGQLRGAFGEIAVQPGKSGGFTASVPGKAVIVEGGQTVALEANGQTPERAISELTLFILGKTAQAFGRNASPKSHVYNGQNKEVTYYGDSEGVIFTCQP
jgi:hypothetical protein